MELRWTKKAFSDVERLYQILEPVNTVAAAKVVQALVKAPLCLLVNPRIGEQLDEFSPREVRRILVGKYEIRYEIREAVIFVLRFWHTRENRQSIE